MISKAYRTPLKSPTQGQHTTTELAALCALLFATRLMPHPANLTPTLALIATLAPWGRAALLPTLLTLLASDVALSYFSGAPAFGSWTLFTLSGALGLAAICQPGRTLTRWLAGTLFYWVWTNFGTWCLAGLYPLTATGLLSCYGMAVPFLARSLLSTSLFYLAIGSIARVFKLQDDFDRISLKHAGT